LNDKHKNILIPKKREWDMKELSILVHANAGLPKLVDGKSVFPETPKQMAALCRK
jgi:methionine synthase I (cobalamin-dependent)